MNNFFVTTVQNMKDGTQPISTFGYADEDSAMSAYHSTCASSRVNENISSYVCLVLNEHGGQIIKEYYVRQQPEPEPNVEEA